MFDEPSSDQNPIFSYRYNQRGEYAYFCRPHEKMGMNGVIFVQKRFVRGDADGDGEVIITDSIAILDMLFLGRE